MSENEKEELITKEPIAEKYIKSFMMGYEKEESFKEIKTRLREELNDLYDRYGIDLVKLVVDEDDLYKAIEKL